MKLNELKRRLLGGFSRGAGDDTRRPDGGTSCYKPIRKRMSGESKAAPREEENRQQAMTYVHTGFTGMNPPSGNYDPGYAGYTQATDFPEGGAYGQQTAYGQPAAYSQQTGYGQPDAYSPAGMQGTYGQQTGIPSQAAWQPEEQTAYGQASRPERGWFPNRQETAPRNNISYMPGVIPDRGGAAFNHVEHIMTMTGLKSCYEAIECMKNGETLILTLDAIANEGESMRCQDMLAGAAFTLGCSVRMLQGARLVLIAPEGVKILPEENLQRMTPPVFAAAAPAAAPENPAAGHRERRSGQHAAEWNAAREGELENYNPYTGTMPVAAGAYGSFGGYGY